MATAEQQAAAAATTPVVPDRKPLWGDTQIQVIVGTGEHGSGKTLFGIFISPGAETLVFDNEGSSVAYKPMGFTHVDVAMELRQKHPNGFTPLQRFEFIRQEALNRNQDGRYRVLMIDPASEFEKGAVEYVMKNPGEFGYTLAQLKGSVALKFDAVKTCCKDFLDQARTVYDTVYLTVHMRDEFKSGRPTGKREPKGLAVLREMASLYLMFDREPVNGVPPKKPNATVLKDRVTKFRQDPETGEWDSLPVLPPRIPAPCTPDRIRSFIENPADYDKLSKGQRIQEKTLSDDDRLLMQAFIAEQNHATEEARVTREQLISERASSQVSAIQPAASPGQAGATVFPSPAQQAESHAVAAAGAASSEQVAQIKELMSKAFDGDREKLKGWFVENQYPTNTAQMSAVVAGRVITGLEEVVNPSLVDDNDETEAKRIEVLAAHKQAFNGDKSRAKAWYTEHGFPTSLDVYSLDDMQKLLDALVAFTGNSTGTAPEEPTATWDQQNQVATAAGPGEPSQEPETATQTQLERLQALIAETRWTEEKMKQFLASNNVAKFSQLSQQVLQSLIERLGKHRDSLKN